MRASLGFYPMASLSSHTVTFRCMRPGGVASLTPWLCAPPSPRPSLPVQGGFSSSSRLCIPRAHLAVSDEIPWMANSLCASRRYSSGSGWRDGLWEGSRLLTCILQLGVPRAPGLVASPSLKGKAYFSSLVCHSICCEKVDVLPEVSRRCAHLP